MFVYTEQPTQTDPCIFKIKSLNIIYQIRNYQSFTSVHHTVYTINNQRHIFTGGTYKKKKPEYINCIY